MVEVSKDGLVTEADKQFSYAFTGTGSMRGSDGITTLAQMVAQYRIEATATLQAERDRYRDVVQEALEFAVMTLAFHCRDRHSDRQEKMLDDLEKLACELDANARTALSDTPTVQS